MKKLLYVGTSACIALALTFVISCKKSDSTTDDTAVQSQTASDDARVNSELENVTNDVNGAVSSASSHNWSTAKLAFATLPGVTAWPCDTTKVKFDSTTTSHSIIFNYSGTGCNGNTTRTGTITVTLNNYTTGTPIATFWSTKGSSVSITYSNYSITKIATGQNIVFNGTTTITNVSGGLLINLAASTADSIVHSVTSNNLQITFSDGTQRTWSISRQKTWKNITPAGGPPVYQISITGTATQGGYSNVAAWGTTRSGSTFYVQFTSPIVFNSTCGWFEPTSGVRVINALAHPITETFGTDASGNPITYSVTAGNCPSYFKINWTNAANVARQVVLPY